MSVVRPNLRLRFADFLFALAAKLRGYETTEYGRGYSDGWRTGVTERPRARKGSDCAPEVPL